MRPVIGDVMQCRGALVFSKGLWILWLCSRWEGCMKIAPENTLFGLRSFFKSFFFQINRNYLGALQWNNADWDQQEISLTLLCPLCLLHMPPGWTLGLGLFAQMSVVSHPLYPVTLSIFVLLELSRVSAHHSFSQHTKEVGLKANIIFQGRTDTCPGKCREEGKDFWFLDIP